MLSKNNQATYESLQRGINPRDVASFKGSTPENEQKQISLLVQSFNKMIEVKGREAFRAVFEKQMPILESKLQAIENGEWIPTEQFIQIVRQYIAAKQVLETL